MYVLIIDGDVVGNLVYCIWCCDMELVGVVLVFYVLGLVVLVEDEQELGVVCVDLGGGMMGVLVFIKKYMIFVDVVCFGGDLIIMDIVKGLCVSYVVVEWLKILYGGVEVMGCDDREMIELGGEIGDWEIDRCSISCVDLIGIMCFCVEEILEKVVELLDVVGFEFMFLCQIVLMGGGSQIFGLDVLVVWMLGQNVCIGCLLWIQGFLYNVIVFSFLLVIGLVLLMVYL